MLLRQQNGGRKVGCALTEEQHTSETSAQKGRASWATPSWLQEYIQNVATALGKITRKDEQQEGITQFALGMVCLFRHLWKSLLLFPPNGV